MTWAERLPSILGELSTRWSLIEIGERFPGKRVTLVAPVRDRDGRASVIKVHPDPAWARYEYEALAHWNGRGCVRPLAFEGDLGAILMERVEPGDSLRAAGADEVEASRVFIEAASTLRAAGAGASRLPHIGTWLARLDRAPANAGPTLFAHHLTAAHYVARNLLASDSRTTVLHGDLHHANLLRDGSGAWIAVDPKGIVGPEEIEPAAFLRNPRRYLLEAPDPVAVLTTRVSTISEQLGYRPARVAGWGYVLTVLSAAWALEDGEGWPEVDRWLRCAVALDQVYRTHIEA